MAKKTAPSVDRFAEPGVARQFKHSDGRTYSLEVDGCRVYESWSLASGKGRSNQSTRDDELSAHAFALAKVGELLKKGYREAKSKSQPRYDREADVIEAYHSDLDVNGDRVCDFQPVRGRKNVYSHANISVAEWLITSDDQKRGIRFRAVLWESEMTAAARGKLADRIIDELDARRADIFADEKTPLRKFAFGKRAGQFSHLVVLSPESANETIGRDVSFANPIISRSIFVAFPAFDCEVTGTESVTMAEARTQGRASLPMNTWDREPHPVVDLAYVKKVGELPKFLVYDPNRVDELFSKKALAKSECVELHARNHAGVTRVWTKGSAAPDLVELRAFFGFKKAL